MKSLNLRNYPGYSGMFTRDQAKGALRNNTRVVKTASDLGDGQPDGSLGTVLGSINGPRELVARFNSRYLYFVEWDLRPGYVVAVISRKVLPIV
jgi:hypothetical protein